MRPLAKKTASLIDGRNFNKANIEQGIMNIEVRYSIELYYADIHKNQVEGLPSILAPSLNPSHRGREVDALYLGF
ncbi:hypothetical protein JY97_05985 [Alkalispirochaeta odontotermitis]|nr:hypothetical protein JY97_05985 [Alkalispirochaeta odontotermitis]CAB1079142.1 hypothetical protein D1AOALGA4SA_6858 [Olavius algarvensis Delta 1 endosymbiont]